MSFVEKNKAWLLPLLGVGVAAVVYLNLRSPAPAGPLDPPPAAAAAVAPPGPTPLHPAAAADPNDLWSDLKALAAPPASLQDEALLRERSRARLDGLLDGVFPTGLPRPVAVREAQPAPQAGGPPAPVAAAAAPPPMPELGFILSGPEGLTAWFQGRSCRAGQAIPASAFRVGAIHWNRAEVIGPTGKTVVEYTHPHLPVAGSRPIVEAP